MSEKILMAYGAGGQRDVASNGRAEAFKNFQLLAAF